MIVCAFRGCGFDKGGCRREVRGEAVVGHVKHGCRPFCKADFLSEREAQRLKKRRDTMLGI